MIVRTERPDEAAAVSRLIGEAFAGAPHASGTEAAIVEKLREEGALAVSLVAVEDGALAGHAAASPVSLSGGESGWFGLGPVAVRADRRRLGIGAALVRAVLQSLRDSGAAGCVVLGDPAYYGRFGFAHDPRLTYGDVPPPYFQRLSFSGSAPEGEVRYHRAFGA